MSLKYCLKALIIVIQSAMALSNELDHFDPVKFLLSNESSVLLSSDTYYYVRANNTALTVFFILWGIFVSVSLILGCILLCVCKPKHTPGRILSTNRVQQGSETSHSSSTHMSSSQSQPPPYQAVQQNTSYPPVGHVMGPQQSGHTVQFQNPIGGNVKPGMIISNNKVVDSQPQSTYVQQHFPQIQQSYAHHPAKQQQFINAETPSVMGTQNSAPVIEFKNPVTDS